MIIQITIIIEFGVNPTKRKAAEIRILQKKLVDGKISYLNLMGTQDDIKKYEVFMRIIIKIHITKNPSKQSERAEDQSGTGAWDRSFAAGKEKEEEKEDWRQKEGEGGEGERRSMTNFILTFNNSF